VRYTSRRRALDTVRRVLLASSAIAVALPPVMIDVSLDGETRQEMHAAMRLPVA
jgi:hypothetical protein